MNYVSPQVSLVHLMTDELIAVSIGGGSEVFTDFGDSAEKITFGNVFDW